jgi:hypothetical protein
MISIFCCEVRLMKAFYRRAGDKDGARRDDRVRDDIGVSINYGIVREKFFGDFRQECFFGTSESCCSQFPLARAGKFLRWATAADVAKWQTQRT